MPFDIVSIFNLLKSQSRYSMDKYLFRNTFDNISISEFYCTPADAYADLLNKIEDIELAQIVKERIGQEEVEVSLESF
jgi:hypothetical protein